MRQVLSFLLIILFFTFSCTKLKSVQEVSENSDSLKVSSDRIVNTITETLNPIAKEAVSEWKEYKNVDDFILKYYNISTTDALYHANELSGLVTLMKDSIRVDLLKGKSIKARFNVLQNETLRLADMSTINSITNKEIKDEVDKIVEVYSAVNSKINTIYKAEELQNSLEIDTETPSLNIKQQNLPKRRGIISREPVNPERIQKQKTLEQRKLGKPVISIPKKTKQ
ncbi:MAG: hypothetical protein HKP59_03875 [Lutibacter sp.]|uniref:hypothetical protein n=1 Tax=Lutibacter sp. TaxID=1925666 RepID=UPI0017AD8778|nr:hypothetical protein [Lutibacter sp.]MBT8316739.1 hypothetical protein [Lutibacter sp.]NNJ57599.1 hypothetical protein [Lutibacter sp.]